MQQPENEIPVPVADTSLLIQTAARRARAPGAYRVGSEMGSPIPQRLSTPSFDIAAQRNRLLDLDVEQARNQRDKIALVVIDIFVRVTDFP